MIDDTNNGNFLVIIELLSRYDPILQDHVSKVREAQKDGKRLQAHYLSYSSQNEFIQLCAEKVKDCILNERDQAKYYSIMVDATPDMSHTEQSTFILRYLTYDECGKYQIQERFFSFIDDSKKTGTDLSEMILKSLSDSHIPFEECRGLRDMTMIGTCQVSTMECRAILNERTLSLLVLTLWLPSDAAVCCKEVVTFFGVVHTDSFTLW